MTPKFYLAASRGTELSELIAYAEVADVSVIGFVFNGVVVRRDRGDSRVVLTERYRKKTDRRRESEDRKEERVT